MCMIVVIKTKTHYLDLALSYNFCYSDKPVNLYYALFILESRTGRTNADAVLRPKAGSYVPITVSISRITEAMVLLKQ